MAGLDANTYLLLHCDGADTSTTFTDASITTNKGNATVGGTAQVDTAQSKFGGASLLLDGNSDYLSYADHADWDLLGSAADNWTIDMWIKLNTHAAYSTLISQYEGVSNYWSIFNNHAGGQLTFYASLLSGGAAISLSGPDIEDSNWHHIALCKVAAEYGIYQDGVQIAYVSDSDTDTFAGLLYIGGLNTTDRLLDGWIDEIRIQHSNYFNAAPNVGKTNTINVPTQAYSSGKRGGGIAVGSPLIF